MTDPMLGLLHLPEHCREAAALIRRHPGLWCKRRLYDAETDQRCGLGWVIKIGDYPSPDDTRAITIIQRANGAVDPTDRPFAVFNDHPDTTALDVADRLDAIAIVLDPTGNG